MAVFPEQMERIDANDTAGSLKRIENYIRYMTERMEFANKNTMRTVTDSGVSTVGVYKAVITLADTVSVLQANMNLMSGNVTTLGNRVAELQTTVSELAERVASLETTSNT